MNSLETNPEILEARKKLADKFVNLKIGGKGIHLLYLKQDPREEKKFLNTNFPHFKIRKFKHQPRNPVINFILNLQRPKN